MKMAPQTSDKVLLRRHFLDLRQKIPSKRRQEASTRLFSFCASKLAGNILSFCSFRSEIDMLTINAFLSQNKRLFLPRLDGSEFKAYLVDAPLSQLLLNRWGLLEPDPRQCPEAAMDEIDAVLVPGLAFDHSHHRIGYGKGCYDRFLKKFPACMTIGVGFCEQLTSYHLPTGEDDVSLKQLALF